jgi:hypothetical protein
MLLFGRSGKIEFLTVPLHNLKILDDHFGARTDQNLALSSLLSVVERLQSIGQDTHTHHDARVGDKKTIFRIEELAICDSD